MGKNSMAKAKARAAKEAAAVIAEAAAKAQPSRKRGANRQKDAVNQPTHRRLPRAAKTTAGQSATDPHEAPYWVETPDAEREGWYIDHPCYYGDDAKAREYDPPRRYSIRWHRGTHVHTRRCTLDKFKEWVSDRGVAYCHSNEGVRHATWQGARASDAPPLADLQGAVDSHLATGGSYPNPALCGRAVLHQHADAYCTTASFANAVGVSRLGFRALCEMAGPRAGLGQFADELRRKHRRRQFGHIPYVLERVKGIGSTDADKLRHLMSMRDTAVLVAFGNHTVAWDTREGIISDPSSSYPFTLPATTETVALLGIAGIKQVYRVVKEKSSE